MERYTVRIEEWKARDEWENNFFFEDQLKKRKRSSYYYHATKEHEF